MTSLLVGYKLRRNYRSIITTCGLTTGYIKIFQELFQILLIPEMKAYRQEMDFFPLCRREMKLLTKQAAQTHTI